MRHLQIVRSECPDTRPCPRTDCRMHLLSDFPQAQRSCALDVAECGGMSQRSLADLLGVSHALVDQIERHVLADLAKRVDEESLEFDPPIERVAQPGRELNGRFAGVLQDRVADLLNEPRTFDELVEATGSKRNLIYGAVARLAKQGRVKKVTKGLWVAA